MCHTFESETELVRYTVYADGGAVVVDTYEQGIATVKNYLSENIMSQLVIERAYYCKWAYAMSQEYTWLYKYGLVWRRVN